MWPMLYITLGNSVWDRPLSDHTGPPLFQLCHSTLWCSLEKRLMFVCCPPECGVKGNFDWIWQNQLPVAVTIGGKARNHCGFRERECGCLWRERERECGCLWRERERVRVSMERERESVGVSGERERESECLWRERERVSVSGERERVSISGERERESECLWRERERELCFIVPEGGGENERVCVFE